MDDFSNTDRDPASEEVHFAREFAREALAEQRRSRRWGIFFKLAFLGYLIVLAAVSMSGWSGGSFGAERHTAVVDLQGVIAHNQVASADNIVTALRNAFEDERTAGVIMRINSPGGSPVQSGYINDEIARLREKYPDIPLYAVVADICASGGYYIAAAADRIYANKASIVGSIGVRMDGFGFTEAIERLGVERRLLTAGEHKGFLDPFLPLEDTEVEHVEDLLGEIHQQFIDTVRNGRGSRLANDERIFTGLVWTGEQGLELGLVDALGSTSFVAREVIGEEELRDFTIREDYFDRLARNLGASLRASLSEIWTLR